MSVSCSIATFLWNTSVVPRSQLCTRQERACAEKSHMMDTAVSHHRNVIRKDLLDWIWCHWYLVCQRRRLVYDKELNDITFLYKCLYGETDLNVSFVTHGCNRPSNSFNIKTPIRKTSAFQASYLIGLAIYGILQSCKSVPKGSLSSISVFTNFLKQTLTSLLWNTFDVVNACALVHLKDHAHAIVHSTH